MVEQSERTRALLRRLMGVPAGGDLEQLLAPGHVLACLAKDAAHLPQAQLTFSFAVNLLSRLHPVVQELTVVAPESVPSAVLLPRWHADQLAGHIRVLLGELKPPVTWCVEPVARAGASVALIVGDAKVEAEHHVYVGSNGWEAIVSPNSPVPIGPLVNPVGAYAAACIAVGEVWKRLLQRHRHLFGGRPIIPLDRRLDFSCLSYRSDAASENPALAPLSDLGRLTVVGLGAGGGAAAYTLASLPRVRSNLTLVEPDEVNLPNLNRYVFATDDDARSGRLKTDVVADLFHLHGEVAITRFAEPFNVAQQRIHVRDLRRVLAAVHSRQVRRDLQYETPQVLWDGGATEDGEFRVWRIALGRTECMFCKHPPDEGDPEQEEAAQLAALLGFDAKMWLGMLRDNRAFTADEIALLSRRRDDLKLEFDVPKGGERYSDWYSDQCGRLRLPEMDQEIPIPFAPVMAGVLLAGEVIKEAECLESVLPHYYGNTLAGSWMRRVQPQGRAPRAACVRCQSPIFRAQFERRWGVRPE